MLDAMSDSSFRDREDSTSTEGYVVRLFGDPVAWKSHQQNRITLYSCQAEYLAMSSVCQEIISLDKAIRMILGKTFFPVTLHCDNRASGECTQKDGSHKLKDFDDNLEDIVKFLEYREVNGKKKDMADTYGDYVKSCVLEGRIKVKWVGTNENIADIMTKALALKAHRYLRDKILEIK